MNLSGVRPGGEASDDVELVEETTDNLIDVSVCTQAIDLRHRVCQGSLQIFNRRRREILALRLEAALTTHKLFAVKVRHGMKDNSLLRAGIRNDA